MQSFSNYLFLLIANLSQQRNKKQIINLFIDGLNSLLPNITFSWSERSDNDNIIPICTRKNTFGYIEYTENFVDLDNKEIAIFQNAIQMLAIILERLLQENLLSRSKVYLEEIVVSPQKNGVNFFFLIYEFTFCKTKSGK